MKKNKKRKWIITVLVIGIAAVGLTVYNVNANPKLPQVKITELKKNDIVNSISSKGVIESVSKRNVYTSLTYKVKEINVEVGDYIKEGEILCVLDTENLEMDIAQQKADLSVSQQNSLNQLKNNQRILGTALEELDNGKNSQIINAENSIKTAEINLESAQRDYDKALSDYENNTDSQVETSRINLDNAQRDYDKALKDYNDNADSQVANAESSLASAELDLSTKKTTYENNKVLYEVGGITKDALTQSEDALTNAQKKRDDAARTLEESKTSQHRSLEKAENSLKTATVNYETALTNQKTSLQKYENSLKTARTNYENALKSLETANNNAKKDIDTYQNNVTNSQISTNTDSKLIAIQKLEKQLEDSAIKAPISGTVTAVYAKEGASPTGIMFVIEDTSNLKITTKIKEYDMSKINVGLITQIRSDSTGDEVYEGTVAKIDPTAVKNSNGETNNTSDVEFGAEINITSKETNLKIGMNTRLTIIVEKKDGVLCVPYDAVTENENGETIIYTVDEQDGNNIVRQLKVTTGMESDFYLEITGDGLAEGLKVISDSTAVKDGMAVAIY